MGYCWGGGASFAYAVSQPELNATVPAAKEAMNARDKSFAAFYYEGAGHGFLRAQSDRDGANMRATEAAWPRTVAFFREHLES